MQISDKSLRSVNDEKHVQLALTWSTEAFTIVTYLSNSDNGHRMPQTKNYHQVPSSSSNISAEKIR